MKELFLVVCFVFLLMSSLLGVTNPNSAQSQTPVLILDDFHGNIPTPHYVVTNKTFLESQPFDGIVFYLANASLSTKLSSQVMVNTPHTYAEYYAILSELNGVQFTRLKHNYVLVLSNKATDFFNDWSVPIQNFANLAAAIRDCGNIEGIAFDNEAYPPSTNYWSTYPTYVDFSGTKTLNQYYAQSKVVGNQVMTAMLAQFPQLKVVTYHGPYISDPNTPNPPFNTSTTLNQLKGSFWAGFMDAIIAHGRSAIVQNIDGGELYQLRTIADFQNTYDWRKVTMGGTANANPFISYFDSQWTNNVSVGFGLYDLTFAGKNMDAATMQTTVLNAMRRTDYLVWLHVEGASNSFLVPPASGGASQAWIDSIRIGSTLGKQGTTACDPGSLCFGHVVSNTSSSVIVSYIANDSSTCTDQLATDAGFTSLVYNSADSGGQRYRYFSPGSLLASTPYYYKITCSANISQGSFVTPGALTKVAGTVQLVANPQALVNQILTMDTVTVSWGTAPGSLTNSQNFSCTIAGCAVTVGEASGNMQTDTQYFMQYQYKAGSTVLATSAIIPFSVTAGTGSPVPPPVVVTVTPSSVTLNAGQSQQFGASVAGTANQNVTWSLNVPAQGSINASGLYTAPASVPSNTSDTVVATSQANPASNGTAAVTLNATSSSTPVTYTSPSCTPNASNKTYGQGTAGNGAWACGSYPTTTVPGLPAVAGCPSNASATNTCTTNYNTYVSDPDTGTRMLRITGRGSLGQTVQGHSYLGWAAGWLNSWNADSTKFLFTGDNNAIFWVGFDPVNFKLTGQSGKLSGVFSDGAPNFSTTDPDIVYVIQNSTWLVSYKISTGAITQLFNFTTQTGWSGQGVKAGYINGNIYCVYSATVSQGTGKYVSCYNVQTAQHHLVDVNAATWDGSPMQITNTTPPTVAITGVNTMHSVVPGPDNAYVFVDTGTAGHDCSLEPNRTDGQFLLKLTTGQYARLGLYCDQTHLAVGFNGFIAQSAASSGSYPVGCSTYDTRGIDVRSFSTINPPTLISGCFGGTGGNQSVGQTSVHVSWLQNKNDANVNTYPLLVDFQDTGLGKHCFLCNEIAAMQVQSTPLSSKVWRFGRHYDSNACSNMQFTSAQIDPSGHYVMFTSDWMGQTGNLTTDSCQSGETSHRQDIFVMELK